MQAEYECRYVSSVLKVRGANLVSLVLALISIALLSSSCGDKREDAAQTTASAENANHTAAEVPEGISRTRTATSIMEATQAALSPTITPIPTYAPIPTITPIPAKRHTPIPTPERGLGVNIWDIQTGLSLYGFSFFRLDEYMFEGDSADGYFAAVSLRGPSDNIETAILQFPEPRLDPDAVALYSLSFVNLVLPDWQSGKDWLVGAFRQVGRGETATETVTTSHGEAYIEMYSYDNRSITIEIDHLNINLADKALEGLLGKE